MRENMKSGWSGCGLWVVYLLKRVKPVSGGRRPQVPTPIVWPERFT
jgi:hypothetical protein